MRWLTVCSLWTCVYVCDCVCVHPTLQYSAVPARLTCWNCWWDFYVYMTAYGSALVTCFCICWLLRVAPCKSFVHKDVDFSWPFNVLLYYSRIFTIHFESVGFFQHIINHFYVFPHTLDTRVFLIFCFMKEGSEENCRREWIRTVWNLCLLFDFCMQGNIKMQLL